MYVMLDFVVYFYYILFVFYVNTTDRPTVYINQAEELAEYHCQLITVYSLPINIIKSSL